MQPPLTWLDTPSTPLPPAAQAWGPGTDAPGLLAAGHDISPARLHEAYTQGIFPWYSPGQPVLWWSPDPRMVLPVAEFKLKRSLRKTLQTFLHTPGCEIRWDSAFERVIHACATTPRNGQNGTWITPELMQAYIDWHHQGFAHSVETWVNGKLVGGLYGVGIGRMFYGESMFAHATDASKLALTALVAFCQANDIPWIDCQQNTRHLASLGAREVSRSEFIEHIRLHTKLATPTGWDYDLQRLNQSSLAPCNTLSLFKRAQ